MSITQTIVRFLQVAAATLLIIANASLAEAAPFAYIATRGTSNVSVIDTATDTYPTRIPGGAGTITGAGYTAPDLYVRYHTERFRRI